VKCLLCAPSGRAAKRLTETTGLEAKTIHRLLEIDPSTGRFSRNESNTLACGLLVVDATSMVDVLLMHSLVRAVPNRAGLVLVAVIRPLQLTTNLFRERCQDNLAQKSTGKLHVPYVFLVQHN
jgi:exodeoxyribonuclease V alpha subunit